MGREVRRVPPNWDHPETEDNYRRMRLQPMYDRTFEQAAEEWLADFDRIRAGGADKFEAECYPRGVVEWANENTAPDPQYCVPWKDDESTWFQVWETVSEGTPVSPPFETEAELISYLAENGDDWDQKRGDPAWGQERAERFVAAKWAPSLVMVGGKIMSGTEFV